MERNNMFSSEEKLECKNCGADLLKDISNSIVVINKNKDKINTVFTCCKGDCDDALGSLSGWKELKEFTNPYLYLKHVMAVINNMHEGIQFSNESLEEYKQILIKTAPYVFRNMDENEVENAAISNMIPF